MSRRRTGAVVGVVLTALLLAGCGSDDAATEADLAAGLAEVDRTIATGRYAAAREAIAALGEDTAAALGSGAIDETRAEAILEAAEALLTALPEPTVPEADPSPSASTTPDEDAEQDDEEAEDDDPEEVEEEKGGKPPKDPKPPQGSGKKDR